MITKLQKIKPLKLLNRNNKLLLSILNGIFVFQMFLNFTIPILIFTIVTFMPLLFDIKFWTISLFIFLLGYLVFKLTEPSLDSIIINGNYEVEDDLSVGSVIKIKGVKILLYKKHFQIGDIVHVQGKSNLVNGNFQDYLHQKNIYHFTKKFHSTIIAKTNDFRNKVYDYLSSGKPLYEKYNPLVLLGKKNKVNLEIYRLAIRENIVHLFVVSGFHFSLLFLIFNKILKYTFKKEIISNILAVFICLFFLYLLRFPISGTRAFLLIVAVSFKKNLKIKVNNMEILSLIMGMMFLIHPRQVTSISFIFTFIATFVLMRASSLKLSKFKKGLVLFTMLSLSTLPLSIFINGFFSPMGLIYSIALTPVFAIAYVLSLFFIPFKNVVNYLDIGVDFILKSFDSINPLVKINISKIFMETFYSSMLGCFIIWEIWHYYMEQKNI